MASMRKRSTDSGPRYDVLWRESDGKQRRKTFASQADARRYRATVEADLSRGTYVDDRNPVTVEQYARAWIASRPQREQTRRRQVSLVDTHLAPSPLGQRRLVDVRATEVQGWVTGLSRVLAPSTTRVALSFVRAIFNGAVQDRLVPSNPASSATAPRAARERVVPLTVEQVTALADAMPARCRAMVIAQAGLGLRVSELFALRVCDVDFLRRTARVEHQLGRDGERCDPKTNRSRRTIPLPRVVADVLAAHLAAYPPASPESVIFTSTVGRPYVMQSYGRTFGQAVERAGLPKGTTSHDLRHHYASVLLAAGESVVAVAERLGHDSAALVLSTYGHLMPDTEDRTRAAVDAAWGASSSSSEGLRAVDG